MPKKAPPKDEASGNYATIHFRFNDDYSPVLFDKPVYLSLE